MESYVVRIRSQQQDPHSLIGQVENAASGEGHEFQNIEELMDILLSLPLTADYSFRVDWHERDPISRNHSLAVTEVR